MISISGIGQGITTRQFARVTAVCQGNSIVEFDTLVCIDAAAAMESFRHEGILQMVLREPS